MKVLITGATGFLGFRICEMLTERGYKQIVALGRNEIQGRKLVALGCQFIQADLRDPKKLSELLPNDIDGIIHSAALSSPWGQKEDFININQIGTRNIVKLAEEKNIQRLVFVSSPSVYFNFKERFNVKETDPVADPDWPSTYTYTKYLAEQEVLASNTIKSVILRPRGLFGPGDTSIIPRLIKANKEGRLPIMGDGETLTDLTYIDNAALSTILALEKCLENDKEIFNISNGEPVKLWQYLGDLLTELEQDFNPKKVPFPIIYTLCFFSELLSKYILKNKEPTLTRYTAGLLAKTLTLDITKAKEKLGYKPLVNMTEAKRLTIEWVKNNPEVISCE